MSRELHTWVSEGLRSEARALTGTGCHLAASMLSAMSSCPVGHPSSQPTSTAFPSMLMHTPKEQPPNKRYTPSLPQPSQILSLVVRISEKIWL